MTHRITKPRNITGLCDFIFELQNCPLKVYTVFMAQPLIVKKEAFFAVERGQLWRALTDPLVTREWMYGCEMLSDFTVGGLVIWKGAEDGRVYARGVVLHIEKDALLSYSVFDPNTGVPDTPDNYLKITYELVPGDGGTSLIITQGDFSRVANGEKRYQDAVAGWDHALKSLSLVVDRV